MPLDNLTPFLKSLTPEEKSEICRRAGKASAKKRQEKKKLGDYLVACLQTKTPTGDVATDMAIALVDEALNGNVSAWQTIRDTIGEKPKDQMELETQGSINIVIGDGD